MDAPLINALTLVVRENLLMIFELLSPEDLARAQRVSNKWRVLAKEVWNKPYPAPKTAFTIENFWIKNWGSKEITFEDKQPFTRNHYKLFKERPFKSTKIQGQFSRKINAQVKYDIRHMEPPILTQVPTMNGANLTLKKIIELFKTTIDNTSFTIVIKNKKILELYGDQEIAPGWVQLIPGVFEDSMYKALAEQLVFIEEYAKFTKVNYRLPKIAEAIICICSRVIKTGICEGYSIFPLERFTRCEETIKGPFNQYNKETIVELMLFVGGASNDSLIIDHYPADSSETEIGIGISCAIRT